MTGEGALLAAAGNPALVTWWRSAAKPFQALPLVQDGAADAFSLGSEELALASASHSSEPRHLAVVDRFMAKVGVTEADLACGPHPPISPVVARSVIEHSIPLTPRWSNCSGKHTGMLAVARHRGWDTAGYHLAGHPVQEGILGAIARWSGVAPEAIARAPDGCAAECFALPLTGMALAYARLGAAGNGAAHRIREAMMAHPFLVAGSGRLCTELMAAWPGRVVAKLGADGIYCAVLPELSVGIALKVADGSRGASEVALLEILRQVIAHPRHAAESRDPMAALAAHARQPIVNTRGTRTGELAPAGKLQFFDV
jgi:L-asparaginase II